MRIWRGVKDTTTTRWARKDAVENTIQNGVKDTKPMDEWVNAESIVEGVMEYGVKETREVTFLNQIFIEETIINGFKETK
jgi:hypothetical protein